MNIGVAQTGGWNMGVDQIDASVSAGWIRGGKLKNIIGIIFSTLVALFL